MIALATACGGRPSAPAHPSEPRASSVAPRPDVSAGNGARDCDNLIAHAVALGIAERPDDQKPTAEERASMHAQLRTAWAPKCETMTSSGYDCALAAHTLAELDACGG